jgi:putative ABC transport system substrate-binding protein
MLRAIEQAAHALEPALVHDEASIAALAARKGEGLLVLPDLFTLANRVLSRPRSPGRRVRTVSWRRTFIDEGGLMSYSTDSGEQVRRAAVYVDRILKGARPADLPLQKPHQIRACNQLADRTNARLHHPHCDACDRRRGHRKARAPVRRAPRPFKSPSANT